MEKIEDNKRKFIDKLRLRYRLQIMNDETFEEKYSLKLTPLRLFVLFGLAVIALIIGTTFIIAFTGLREYIPGYAGDYKLRRQLVDLASKVDSLEQNAAAKDLLLENIRKVMSGEFEEETANARSSSKKTSENVRLTPSSEEAKFRKEVEELDKYELNTLSGNTQLSAISSYYFFPPLKGKVTTAFNPAERHYGVDVVAPKNEAVKATLDGTVIFAGWTSETGHVIQLQHTNNLVSVYKHNSVILKKQGQSVKAGEAVAITGNSGELTTTPHLHFELWFDGKPIDPQDFMVF